MQLRDLLSNIRRTRSYCRMRPRLRATTSLGTERCRVRVNSHYRHCRNKADAAVMIAERCAAMGVGAIWISTIPNSEEPSLEHDRRRNAHVGVSHVSVRSTGHASINRRFIRKSFSGGRRWGENWAPEDVAQITRCMGALSACASVLMDGPRAVDQ